MYKASKKINPLGHQQDDEWPNPRAMPHINNFFSRTLAEPDYHCAYTISMEMPASTHAPAGPIRISPLELHTVMVKSDTSVHSLRCL